MKVKLLFTLFIPLFIKTLMANDLNGDINFVKLSYSSVEKYIKEYIKAQEIKGGKGIVYIKVISKKRDTFHFYINSFIEKSDLSINRPPCYTVINNEIILIYGLTSNQSAKKENYRSFYNKVTKHKLVNDLNSDGTINKDQPPISYDSQPYELFYEADKLILKKPISSVPGIKFKIY